MSILSLLACSLPQVSPAVNSKEFSQFPSGDLRNCLSVSPEDSPSSLQSMDALPGTGYDVLRDINMAPVLNYNYSSCQISKDGKHLLPDNFYLSPVKWSVIEEFAEYFDH